MIMSGSITCGRASWRPACNCATSRFILATESLPIERIGVRPGRQHHESDERVAVRKGDCQPGAGPVERPIRACLGRPLLDPCTVSKTENKRVVNRQFLGAFEGRVPADLRD